jgi:4'-phosphopantetheinyl transferase
LRFNLSHSQGLALFALVLDRNVGVDVEALRTLPNAEQIAERFFSPAERAAFRALPPDQRQLAFFRCWTQKEAFIKALGEGLSLALDRFDVSVSPHEAARLLRVDGDAERASRWVMQSLDPGPGFLGALACDGFHQLFLWDWNWLDL